MVNKIEKQRIIDDVQEFWVGKYLEKNLLANKGQASVDEWLKVFHEALDQLPNVEREIITEVYVRKDSKNLTHSEIYKKLGVSKAYFYTKRKEALYLLGLALGLSLPSKEVEVSGGGEQMIQLERTLTSMEIAEMVGREHYDVMKDIRRIISHLGEGTSSVTYFIESEYTDSQGKQRPAFKLTKKGCELYATRMTGEKGTQFAVKYIERFNEMEETLKQNTQEVMPQGNLELALRAALEHEQSIKQIKTDVDYLKDNMRIDSLQQQEIQQTANRSVVCALGGKDSVAYKEMGRKVFASFWNEFKQYFKIPRYGDIQKVKFDEAIRFIELWRPTTSLQIEIDTWNHQGYKILRFS